MRFLNAGIAAWAAAAFAAGLLLRALLRRRRSAAVTVPWMFGAAYRASFIRRLPSVFFLLAAAFLVAALADPVVPFSEVEMRSRGLDVVLVVDLSSSMEIEMAGTRAPGGPGQTRLEATRRALKSLIARRNGDRIGLVVFSEHAYVVSPLTFDYDYLDAYVDFVDDQLLRGEGLTAIGEGVAAANDLLRRMGGQDGRHGVVVVFTDGENNAGRAPLEVLKESSAARIRVHMIGIALESDVRQKPEVRQVVDAIRRYGGLYFDAGTPRELDAASKAIDATEKGSLVSHVYERQSPVYQWFALPALVCLAAGFGLRAVPWLVDQT